MFQLLFFVLALSMGASLSTEAKADLEVRTQYPMPRGPHTEGMVVYGDYLYVLRGMWYSDSPLSGINVFKFSGSDSLTQTSYFYIGGRPIDMCHIGNYIYVVDVGSRLTTLDVTIPEAPKVVNSLKPLANGDVYTMHCLAAEQRIYLSSTGTNQVVTISIANPAAPAHHHTFSSAGGPNAVLRLTDRLYVVSNASNDLKTYNITDEANPVLLSTVALAGSNNFSGARLIAAVGDQKLVTSFWGSWSWAGHNLMDITNRDIPSISQQLIGPASSTAISVGSQLTIRDGFIFSTGYYSAGINVIDMQTGGAVYRHVGEIAKFNQHDLRIDHFALKGDLLILATGSEMTIPRIFVIKMNLFP